MRASLIPLIPFYFIKHGETDWHCRRLIIGQKNPPLNERGRQQAELAALTLKKNKDIKSILTSPLQRARATAEIIQEALQCPIHVLDDLKSVSFGPLEGHSTLNNIELKRWIHGIEIEGAETRLDFFYRTIRVFREALSYEAPVLIVSHACVWVELQRVLKRPQFRIEKAVPYLVRPPSRYFSFWNIEKVKEAGDDKEKVKGEDDDKKDYSLSLGLPSFFLLK